MQSFSFLRILFSSTINIPEVIYNHSLHYSTSQVSIVTDIICSRDMNILLRV